MMKIDYSERKQNAIIKMVLYHRYTDNRNEFYNLPFNDKKPVDKVIAAMERKLVLGRTDIKNYLVIDNKTNTIIKKVNLV
ncbi:MAG: hypothetical protein MJ069_09950 [Salinivirgaceae bacterium]|nr:hypothetical protein [Salinivirgaceae bacterium]